MSATTTGRIPGSRQVTANRYTMQADGDVFDHWNGYYISARLWRNRIQEGRGDRQRHNFEALMERPVPIGQGWFLNPVQCTRCGERREIGTSVSQLNYEERWCVLPPTLWQRIVRLFGGAS